MMQKLVHHARRLARSRRMRSLALALASASPVVAQQRAASPDTLIAEAHYLRVLPHVDAELRQNPDNVQALIHKSVLDWAFFRFDAAIAAAEHAVALASQSASAHAQLTNALGAKLQASENAGTFARLALARRFRKEADLSVQLDPNSLDALEDAARFYWEAPSIAGGDRSRARQLADRVAQLDPARAAALKARFLADEQKDPAQRAAAITALWQAAIVAASNNADAHAGLAAACLNEGTPKYALAESEARRAIALAPSRIAPYRTLAALYATTGRWSDLDALLKQSQAAVPDNLSPTYQAARVILTANAAAHFSRAEQYLRSYLAQPAEGEEPSHAQAHWRLGLVLEKLGRRSDAIRELEAALHEDNSLDGVKQDLKRLN
ncbi:MAG TPA: hypothetical protein VGC07_02600 [Granulicella sp.]